MQCITCNQNQVIDFPFVADSGESISKTKMGSLLPSPEIGFPLSGLKWILHFDEVSGFSISCVQEWSFHLPNICGNSIF